MSNAPVPYTALLPESRSSTATDTAAPSATVTDRIASAGSAVRPAAASVPVSVTASTDPLPLASADADDDTAVAAPGGSVPAILQPPAARPVGRR
ncbi:hypothetical protein [Streptomyces naganishii]|uniref:hypothetical protein n=1 Tax=Streptomyces naganishii TaxID=285447 RepID=UPI00167CAB4A|nr:hypothetical protein [Streptomyces naganishii]